VSDGGRRRLDALLTERGLTPTRSRAADLVRRGLVRVDGQLARKPGGRVSPTITIEIDARQAAYVSRSAHKLLAVMQKFHIDASGLACLDLGASTGGFTQILLEAGARKVYAVDVGHDQLHESLLRDARVVSLEGVNARDLDEALVPEPVGVISSDVSFVSLLKILSQPLTLADEGCWLAALVKPQFEVGPKHIGKGGVVRDEAAALAAVERVSQWIGERPGWRVLGVEPSPLRGRHGNQEYVLCARKDTDVERIGRTGSICK